MGGNGWDLTCGRLAVQLLQPSTFPLFTICFCLSCKTWGTGTMCSPFCHWEEKQSPRLVAAVRFDLPSSQRDNWFCSVDASVFIVWRHGEHQREEEGWGSEDTSCYTSKHPTSSADVTEIGEKKREKMSHSWSTVCIIEADREQHNMLNMEASWKNMDRCSNIHYVSIKDYLSFKTKGIWGGWAGLHKAVSKNSEHLSEVSVSCLSWMQIYNVINLAKINIQPCLSWTQNALTATLKCTV